MLKIFCHFFCRDLKLMLKNRGMALRPFFFFILIGSLFAIIFSHDMKLITNVASGIIWIAALLSVVLSLENLLKTDFEDGSLLQFVLSPYPLPLILFSQLLAHIVIISSPIIVTAPVLAIMLHLPSHAIMGLLLTLLLGLPILVIMGSLSASLVISLKEGGLFLALLTLPLLMPVLLLGVAGTNAANQGEPFLAELALLMALLLFVISAAPFTMAYLVRLNVEN